MNNEIQSKWNFDILHLPLADQHYEMYMHIHQMCWNKLQKFPDLINCSDFNDKMQWLKLFDQDEIMIKIADKLLAKEYIKSILGDGFTPKTLQVKETFQNIDFSLLPPDYVLKVNNDSGTVKIVKNKAFNNVEEEMVMFNTALSKGYGWTNGEWMYSYIEPKIFAEEYIDCGSEVPPDFKFHCVNGDIAWLQLIHDRGLDTAKEVNVDQHGNVLDFLFNPDLIKSNNFTKPNNWEQLKAIAKKLAAGWKYIRVDLYTTNNKIYVGELTFYPLAGCINADGQREAGKLINFDRSQVKPAVLNKLESVKSRFKIYKEFR